MRRSLAALVAVLALIPLHSRAAEPTPAAPAAAPAPAGPKLSAKDILDKMDANNNAFEDETLEERLSVVDVDGTKKSYDMLVQQKGDTKRLISFTSGEMKGMATLVEEKDSVYVYLPGFKKVRRVAAHNMNQTIAGSDMSNEDSAITSWAKDWEPTLDKEDESSYWLLLAPKPSAKTDYSKVLHRVDKGTFAQHETHYFGKSGEKVKQMINTDLTDWGGTKRFTYRTVTITDARTGHKTILETKVAKFNQGLKDDLFTVRQLQWGK